MRCNIHLNWSTLLPNSLHPLSLSPSFLFHIKTDLRITSVTLIADEPQQATTFLHKNCLLMGCIKQKYLYIFSVK